jgi:hypothetical protein
MAKSEHRTLCASKGSRARMAQQTTDLAAQHGWETDTKHDAREITVSLRKGALRVSLDFDGASHVNAFLAHWNVDTSSDLKPYTAGFAVAIRGSNNPYHLCKATTCEDTFRGFLASLEGGFRFLASLNT